MTIVAALPSHDAAVLRHFLSVMLRPSQRGFCLLEISAAKIFSWATATLQRFSRPFLYLIYILCTVWNMPYQTFWVLLHKSTQNLGGWDDKNSYFFSMVDFMDNFTVQSWNVSQYKILSPYVGYWGNDPSILASPTVCRAGISSGNKNRSVPHYCLESNCIPVQFV